MTPTLRDMMANDVRDNNGLVNPSTVPVGIWRWQWLQHDIDGPAASILGYPDGRSLTVARSQGREEQAQNNPNKVPTVIWYPQPEYFNPTGQPDGAGSWCFSTDGERDLARLNLSNQSHWGFGSGHIVTATDVWNLRQRLRRNCVETESADPTAQINIVWVPSNVGAGNAGETAKDQRSTKRKSEAGLAKLEGNSRTGPPPKKRLSEAGLEASRHEIVRDLICPVCKKLFTRADSTARHVRTQHNGEKRSTKRKSEAGLAKVEDNIPIAPPSKKRMSEAGLEASRYETVSNLTCPVCEKPFTRPDSVLRHVREQHSGGYEECPCPQAKEHSCNMFFRTKRLAAEHAKNQHSEEYGKYPCPEADKYGCDLTFSTKQVANQHAKEQHSEEYGKHPCPEADKYGCTLRFSTKRLAAEHAKEQHSEEYGKYPCPQAKEYNCTLFFATKRIAAGHAKEQHSEEYGKHSCPQAKEYNCTLFFATKRLAAEHAKEQHSEEYGQHPCPEAEKSSCSKMFSTKRVAQQHALNNHGQRCPGCPKSFYTLQELNTHLYPKTPSISDARFHQLGQLSTAHQTCIFFNAQQCRASQPGAGQRGKMRTCDNGHIAHADLAWDTAAADAFLATSLARKLALCGHTSNLWEDDDIDIIMIFCTEVDEGMTEATVTIPSTHPKGQDAIIAVRLGDRVMFTRLSKYDAGGTAASGVGRTVTVRFSPEQLRVFDESQMDHLISLLDTLHNAGGESWSVAFERYA